MKKIIVIIVVLFMAYSCSDDETSVFEKNATERANQNRDEFYQALNESNWIIQLFPNNKQSIGGYSIYADFNTDNKVTLTNEYGDSDSGTNYDVLSRSGSMLTFNEYNEGIHRFSNTTFGENFEGQKGDFEFIYQKRDGDVLYTKGVKTRNDIRFVKTDLTTDGYFEKVNLFSGRGFLGFTVNGTEIPFASNKRLFSYSVADEDNDFSFVYTDKGISLYEPITIDGVEISELTFDEVANVLKNDDGSAVIKLSFPLTLDFTDTRWNLEPSKLSPAMAGKLTEAIDAVKLSFIYSVYPLDPVMFALGKTRDGKQGMAYVMYDSSPGGIGALPIDKYLGFSGGEEEGEVSIFNADGGGEFSNYFDGMEIFSDFIVANSPYKTEVDTTNPAIVKMISKADPNVWFVMEKE